MASAFADHIKLPLKVIALQSIGRADEKLHDVRFGGPRRRADIRRLGLRRHLAPANALLALLGNDRLHRRDALLPFGFVLGQEHQSRTEPPFLGQLHAEILLGHRPQETLGQSDQNPRAIAGIRLAPATAAMFHIAQHLEGIEHVLMRRLTFQVGHKTNAATILLIRRVVETLLLRKSNLSCSIAHVQQKMPGETTMPGCLGQGISPPQPEPGIPHHPLGQAPMDSLRKKGPTFFHSTKRGATF